IRDHPQVPLKLPASRQSTSERSDLETGSALLPCRNSSHRWCVRAARVSGDFIVQVQSLAGRAFPAKHRSALHAQTLHALAELGIQQQVTHSEHNVVLGVWI